MQITLRIRYEMFRHVNLLNQRSNVLNEPKLKVHGTDEKNVTLDGSRMISILSKRISFPCFYITIVFKSNYLEYKVYKS